MLNARLIFINFTCGPSILPEEVYVSKKLKLEKQTIRVLSGVELHHVIGGRAVALGGNLNTLSIHCSSACYAKVQAVAAAPVIGLR
ncbi:MAG: hypothetical protein AB7U73_17360 [Pirellulales bacterium]